MPHPSHLGAGPSLRFYGEDLTEEHVVEAAGHLITAMNLVSAATGGPADLGITCTRAVRMCDGCDARAEDILLPAGWVHAPHDHRDYCPACLIGGAR